LKKEEEADNSQSEPEVGFWVLQKTQQGTNIFLSPLLLP